LNHFAKTLKTQLGNTDFIFKKTLTANTSKYHVEAHFAAFEPYHFTIEQKEEEWRIVNAPKVPAWIKDAEKDLILAILMHTN